MSESRLKRLSEQLAEEPKEKLLEIIERQQEQLGDLSQLCASYKRQAEIERQRLKEQHCKLEKAEAANLGLSVLDTTTRNVVVGYMGGCTCAGEAPTVPTCRDRMTHLPTCPAFGKPGIPVGAIVQLSREHE